MARPRKGIIFNLEQVLAKLLETNGALNKRLAQLEAVLIGRVAPARRGRKPGRKRGRKLGRKPKIGMRASKATVKICSVQGCGRPHYAKGLCASHYQQARLKAKEKNK